VQADPDAGCGRLPLEEALICNVVQIIILYYNWVMKTVQARLDAQTEKTLEQLVDRLGVSPSIVVREAIRLFAASQPQTREIAGLGKFSSGISDLGSNKKHLRGFGR
jgi:hypothetical protein